MDKLVATFNANFAALNQLAEEEMAAGWINEQLLRQLHQIEQQQPDDLFTKPGTRPLIVAFFGGTGTGKSSLLNRMAGTNIARTGIVRPTSHEVTLYLHRSIELANLPTELPLDLINISYHDDADKKLIAWLDTPDFDSTETTNRELVEQWLPYIDWLVYVVSPERYQDDSGWQILLQRSQRHHWLFVMNHWDEGTEVQFEDFKNKLITAGIDKPVILRTSCAETPLKDDFDQLEATIGRAIKEYGLTLLKSLGLQVKINDLSEFANAFRDHTGSQQQWEQAKLNLDNIRIERITELTNSLKTSINAATLSMIDQESQSFQLFKTPGQMLLEPESMVKSSISTRSLSILNDIATELPLVTRLNSLDALTTYFNGFPDEGRAIITATLEASLEQALARPGTALQRFLYKTSGLFAWLLPLVAAIWAGFHLVSAYLKGTTETGEFLGSDFAIHSLLLIAICWFIPFILHRKVQPSLAKTARQGLLNGAKNAKSKLTDIIEERFSQALLQRKSIRQRLDIIIAKLSSEP